MRYWMPQDGKRRPKRESSTKKSYKLRSTLFYNGRRGGFFGEEVEPEVLLAWASFAAGGQEESGSQFYLGNSTTLVLGADDNEKVKQSLASPESELLWKSLVWQPLIRRVQEKKVRVDCRSQWRPVIAWSWHHIQAPPYF